MNYTIDNYYYKNHSEVICSVYPSQLIDECYLYIAPSKFDIGMSIWGVAKCDCLYKYVDDWSKFANTVISIYNYAKKQVKNAIQRYNPNWLKSIYMQKLSTHCILGGVVRRQ